MSGGSHDYAQNKLEEIAESFSPTEPTHKEERKKVAKLLRFIGEICHDIEWIDSGDYGEEDWEKVITGLERINIK